MTKRITLSAGDWIKLSEIPNEQVFNLVKQCFVNAGFNDCNGKYAQWENAEDYKNLGAGLSEWSRDLVEFTNGDHKRQLSLSDVFNSVNGGWCWKDCEYIFITVDGHCTTVAPKLPYGVSRVIDTIKRIPEAPEAIIPPKTSQWWDYEKGCAVGLPPVDTECEYSLSNGRTWYKCKVISQDKLVLDCPHVEDENGNGLQIVNKNAVLFRPLDYKTPKQIAVDKAFACLSEFRSAEQVLGELYDMGMLQAI